MQGGRSLQRINFRNVQAIPGSTLVQYVNEFVLSSVQFLNRFSSVCETKLSSVSTQLARLEATMSILEAKLESIPGLDVYDVPLEDSDGSDSDDGPLPASTRKGGEPAPAPGGGAPPAATPTAAPGPVATVRVVKDNPRYKRFFTLLKTGVPEATVRNLMVAQGLNPDLVNTPNAPDPDVEGAVGNQPDAPVPSVVRPPAPPPPILSDSDADSDSSDSSMAAISAAIPPPPLPPGAGPGDESGFTSSSSSS